MAAKRSRAAALTDHRMEHVVAAEVGRLVVMLWPWPLWGLLWAAGWRLHRVWPGWSTAWMILAVGLLLAALAVHLTHQRRKLTAKLLAPVTTLAAFTWLALAEAYGPGLRTELFKVWAILGAGACLGWSMWLHIHDAGDEMGSRLFTDAAEHTSVPGLRAWVTATLPGRTSGTMRVPRGSVPGQVVKATSELESALSHKVPAGIAPGSLTITENPDSAHMVNWTLTDPRKLDKPTLWPGPSLPGGSIADPCRLGLFVDGKHWEVPCFPRDTSGWQCLVMGITGAAKTTGLGYSWLGEIITRRDVVTCAIDLSKGEQFMGVLRPALHTLDLDYLPAKARLWRLHQLRRQRSDYLATQGLTAWQEGCGLAAIVVWIEEASALFRQLGDNDVERWVLPLVLEARSAGIFIVLSLQRADFTQMPTTVRAQLGSICMGVRDSGDAAFGLSDDQAEHGCAPERWKNEKPGMAYSDTPGLPGPEYKFSEARTYYWGRDTSLMAAHAVKYPASARPADTMTQHMLIDPPPAKPEAGPAGKPRQAQQPPPATTVADEEEPAMEPTEYDDPALWRRTPDDAEQIEALDPDPDEPRFGPPQDDQGNVTRLPLSQEAANAKLAEQVAKWRAEGHTEITLAMLLPLTAEYTEDGEPNPDYIDRSRGWLYPAMAALVADEALGLEQLDAPRRWAFIAA